MKRVLQLLFFLGLGLSFIFSAWYALHNDMTMPSDIGRDFLLFGEIATKKIILIGERSSGGLFHGPLWLYLNFPAYLIGNGNPLTVEWWWITMAFLILIPYFYIAKELFNKKVAYLFVLYISLFFSFHTRFLINPDGAMFCLPIFFFFFIKYLQTWNLKFLLALVFTAGIMIQFELVIGIPMLALSSIYLFFRIFRSNHKRHLLGFLIIFIPLASYFIFDLRHQFIITHSIFHFLSPSGGAPYDYLASFYQKIGMMLGKPEFIRTDPNFRNFIITLIFMVFWLIQVKNNKYRTIYFSFLYFYVGFFVLTFINKGNVLYFYNYPLFPFIALIFTSFLTSKYAKLFLVIFFICYLLNINSAYNDTIYSKQVIGKDQTSWQFLDTMAKTVFSGKEKGFGYFVYTPDIVAYSPKYALFYEQNQHKSLNASYLTKKPVTYITIEPPSKDNPYLSYTWWRNVRVTITNQPVQTIKFPNGYKIEKYLLSPGEVNIPFDHSLDPGLGFR
jgi:hypothetical protein